MIQPEGKRISPFRPDKKHRDYSRNDGFESARCFYSFTSKFIIPCSTLDIRFLYLVICGVFVQLFQGCGAGGRYFCPRVETPVVIHIQSRWGCGFFVCGFTYYETYDCVFTFCVFVLRFFYLCFIHVFPCQKRSVPFFIQCH